MTKLYCVLLLLLVFSCGKDVEVEVIPDGPDSLLIIDKFCTTRVARHSFERNMHGTRRLVIREQNITCRMLNVTKSEYLSENYKFEEVFEEGERVWILGDEAMDYVHEYLIRNNLIEEEGEQ